MSIPLVNRESKIFDPRDASTSSYGCELLDCSVARRGNDWWMVLAGQPNGYGATDLFSANLPAGSRLSATGWKPLRNAAGELVPLASRDRSEPWDGKGGRHCPSYVEGCARRLSRTCNGLGPRCLPTLRKWFERLSIPNSQKLFSRYLQRQSPDETPTSSCRSASARALWR